MRHSLACLWVLLAGGCAGFTDSKLYCCTDPGSCPEVVACDRDPSRPVCDDQGVQGPRHTCVAGGIGPDAQTRCDSPTDCSGSTPVCRTTDGVCVECLEDTSCTSAAEPVCGDDDACRACALDAECAGRAGHTQCKEAAGTCVECTENAQCGAAAPVCDTTTDACRGCKADAECGSGVCNLIDGDAGKGQCVAEDDVIYVDKAALVGNLTCTKALKCKTINKGVEVVGLAVDGITPRASRKWIVVAPGPGGDPNYAETVPSVGTITKTFVLKGTGAVLQPFPANSPGFLLGFTGTTGANVRLEGLTITGGTGNGNADGIRCAGDASAVATLTLREAVLSSNTGSGVEATTCTVDVARSTISGNDGGGISVNSSSFLIVNNFIFDNGDENASAFGGVQVASVGAGQADPLVVSFNTFLKNQAQANAPTLFCSGVAKSLTLRNNVLWGRAADAQDQVTEIANCTHHFSLIGPGVYGGGGTGNVDITGIPADATSIFVSPTGPFNLHLKTGSPAINKADPAATEPLDIEGETRPKGTVRDIGADEAE